jgi:putative exporter of polyketide antibiotics
VGGFELSRLEKKQNRTLRFVNKSLKMHFKKRHKIEWNIVLISFESVYCTIVGKLQEKELRDMLKIK